MPDVEVHVDLAGETRPVGLLRRHVARRAETITFEYDPKWLADSVSLFARTRANPDAGRLSSAARPSRLRKSDLAISAPDTLGRRLMQCSERRQAEGAGRAVRTLTEIDYLLGVSDGDTAWRMTQLSVDRQSGVPGAVLGPASPALIELGKLLQITERILRDEETDDDLQIIFAPGSSLGGARPKASVIDQHGHLAIAKFPKETDDYSMETWEEIALRLAERAGIADNSSSEQYATEQTVEDIERSSYWEYSTYCSDDEASRCRRVPRAVMRSLPRSPYCSRRSPWGTLRWRDGRVGR